MLTSQLRLPLSYAYLSATLTSQLRWPLSYAYLSATLTSQLLSPLSYAHPQLRLPLSLSYAHVSAMLTPQLRLPFSFAYLSATLTFQPRLPLSYPYKTQHISSAYFTQEGRQRRDVPLLCLSNSPSLMVSTATLTLTTLLQSVQLQPRVQIIQL